MPRYTTIITLIVSFAVTRAVVAQQQGEVIFADDFDNGHDQWNLVDNTTGRPWGPGIFDTDAGEFRLTTGPLEGGDWFGTSLYGVLQESQHDDRFANGILKASMRAEDMANYAMIGLRWQGGLPSYGFTGFTDDGTLCILRIADTLPAPCMDISPGSIFQPGNDWIVEAAAIGDRLTMRFWPEDGARPDVPQLAVIDDEPYEASRIYIGGGVDGGVVGAATDLAFDDVQFSWFPNWIQGDFSVSGELDAVDIDALSAEVRSEENDRFYDLTSDGLVNDDDRQFWIKNLKQTYIGDANLDGEFNSADLVAVFTAGEYEDPIEDNSTWAEGDWDADGDFGSGDLVAAFTDGGYQLGLKPAVNAVPEPASFLMLMTGLIGIVIRRRHDV